MNSNPSDFQSYDQQEYGSQGSQGSEGSGQDRDAKNSEDGRRVTRNEDKRRQSRKKQDEEDNEQFDEESSSEQEGSVDESGQTRQLKLEYFVLKGFINKERTTQYQEQLVADIVDRLNAFQNLAFQKSGEQLVVLRIQQLALTRILVQTYSKSEFRLALAHSHLGEAYLLHSCIDQAIEHLSLAMHKNAKLHREHPQTQIVHTFMMNALAEAMYRKDEFDEAISLLGQSIQLEGQLTNLVVELTDEHFVRNVKPLMLLANCHRRQKHFNEAIKAVQQILSMEKELTFQQQAFALVERSTIQAEENKLEQAVQSQQQAINILINSNYEKPQEVAQLYNTLAGLYEKLNNSKSCLNCMQKVKTLYQELYDADDKRVIRARRKIATTLLRTERFKEAVNELLQILELQERVFGEHSVHAARTLKILGTVYITLEGGDAKLYLKKAMSIFQALGNKKQVEGIKEKLKLIGQGITFQQNDDAKIGSEQDL